MGQNTKKEIRRMEDYMRFMSLKESARKEKVKVGQFEKFCKERGFERKKGLWEKEVEK